MEFEELFSKMLLGEKYYTSKELIYDTSVGVLLSPYGYKEFADYKTESSFKDKGFVKVLDLKTFNGHSLFYCLSRELLSIESSYFGFVINDFLKAGKPLSIRNLDDISLSRIYSEVEGTLNIESVPTTRKTVSDIATGKKKPSSLNEQIIKNMIEGIEFVNEYPDFNEENLFKLYTLLSKDCLDEEDQLLEGHHYRHDGVEVGGYNGCPSDKIKECMDSLFEFVEKNKRGSDLEEILPHIAHYYMVYVHPYFDYNGRTARMVSYWVSLLTNQKVLPPLVSEAINQTKTQYYNALSETRDANNDLTYFLTYLFKVSISYFVAYQNIEEIDQNLKNKSIVLSAADKAYFKKILISNKGKFTHNDFTKWVDVNMSKQGALKILNAFEEYGLLTSTMSQSGKKLFEVNSAQLKYHA